jgi:hypothetical protein
MKTLTVFTLVAAVTIAMSAPVQADAITDSVAGTLSEQLTELRLNIRQQATSALEQTATELFFVTAKTQTEQVASAAHEHKTAQPAPATDE